MALESIKKALGFSVKLEAVLRLRKTSKTVSKTTFWGRQKSCLKYLIKPVVYEDFWGSFRKMALKSIKKALGFPLKVEGGMRLCKIKYKKALVLEHSGASKKVDQETL